MDLSEFADQPDGQPRLLRQVTEKIMTAITALLEDLRGEQRAGGAVRPAGRRASRRTGDPRRINPGKRSA